MSPRQLIHIIWNARRASRKTRKEYSIYKKERMRGRNTRWWRRSRVKTKSSSSGGRLSRGKRQDVGVASRRDISGLHGGRRMHTRRAASIIDITALCYISFYVSAFCHAARLSVSNVRLSLSLYICFVHGYTVSSSVCYSANVRTAVTIVVHDARLAVVTCKTPRMFY